MTTPVTETTTADQVAALARDYRNLEGQRALIEEQQSAIKARVRDLLNVGDRVVVDGKAVTITPNRRFDPARARVVLTEPQLELITTFAINSSRAKEVLPPAIYDLCMSEIGAPKVVLA